MSPGEAIAAAGGLFLAWTGGVFLLGRAWGRDSGPRADPYGSVPFKPSARDLADQARSASLQSRYERLVVVPPRGGLGLNQYADMVFDQGLTGGFGVPIPLGGPAKTMAPADRSPDWRPDYSGSSKGFPEKKTEVE